MFFEIGLILFCRMLACEAVGVVAVGQEEQLHVYSFSQKHVYTSLRGLDSSRVTIVDHSYVSGETVNGVNLFVGECRAGRSHHVLYSHLMHSHHVGVALHEIAQVLFHYRLLSLP